MNTNAFFYEGRYYLLPEGCTSFTQLLSILCQAAEAGKPLEMVQLQEKNCMAPYFTLNEMRTKHLNIRHPSAVYPAQVAVLTSADYNARLRQMVQTHCPGCARFASVDARDESLKGYHVEISLDGCCMLRREKGTPPPEHFRDGLEHVVDLFHRFHEPLERLLDAGQADTMTNLLAQWIDGQMMSAPPYIFAVKQGSDYICFFTSLMNDTLGMLLGQLTHELEKLALPNWRFYNYIPKGMVVCAPTTDLPCRFEVATHEREFLEIVINVADERDETLDRAYLTLCGMVGEHRLLNAASCIDFVTETDGDWVSKEELADAIDEILDASQLPEARLDVPAVCVLPTGDGDGTLDGGEMLITRHPDLSMQLQQNPETLFSDAQELGMLQIPVGILELTLDNWNAEEALQAALAMLDQMKEQRLLNPFHYTAGGPRSQLAFLINDRDALLYAMRRYTPMLEPMQATLRILTGTKNERYTINYAMPAEILPSWKAEE